MHWLITLLVIIFASTFGLLIELIIKLGELLERLHKRKKENER